MENEKIYFHGTIFDFQTFDSQLLGYSCSNPTTRFGFFFSSDFHDALYWAKRSAQYNIQITNPRLRMVKAHLNLQKTHHMSYEKFYYYLQTARKSTIERHLNKWIEQGYDSLSLIRDGYQWTAVFNSQNISLLSNEIIK